MAAAREIDLSGLGIPELRKLQEDAEQRMEEIREDQVREARAELEKLADDLAKRTGIPRGQLLANIAKSGRKGGKVAAKFRNPANPSQTWAGRGKKPAWVQEHLSRGGKLEELSV